MCSLAELYGSEAHRKIFDFMLTFCLIASSMPGRTYCTTFPMVGQEVLWIMGLRHMGPAGRGPKYSFVCESYDTVQFSTSYTMNPSKLPEGLLLTEFVQINSQRTDNPECKDINQNHNITNVC